MADERQKLTPEQYEKACEKTREMYDYDNLSVAGKKKVDDMIDSSFEKVEKPENTDADDSDVQDNDGPERGKNGKDREDDDDDIRW